MTYIRLHLLKVPILLLAISLGYLVNQLAALWKPTVGTNGGGSYQSGISTLAWPGQVTESQQSSAQKSKDISECYELAKARTGIDPKLLGQSETVSNSEAKPAQSASEALTQAAKSADNEPVGLPAEKGADKNPNQTKLDTFNAANQTCLHARGYATKAPSASAKPDEK